MPIYLYRCPLCYSDTEVVRGIMAPEDAPVCDDCGCKMEMAPTAPAGFLLRGKGFHRNDYPAKSH